MKNPPRARQRRRFTLPFKDDAVRMVIADDRIVMDVAQSLGAERNCVDRWKQAFLCRMNSTLFTVTGGGSLQGTEGLSLGGCPLIIWPTMKTILAMIVVVALLGSAGISLADHHKKGGPGPKAQNVSLEHKKLQILVGDWAHEGEQKDGPFGPAAKFKGTIKSQLIFDGVFVSAAWEETHSNGAKISGKEIHGYNSATKEYCSYFFNSDGTKMVGKTNLGDDWATIEFEPVVVNGKKYLIKGRWDYASDLKSFVALWKLSSDGGNTWSDFLSYKAKKK